MPKIKRPIKCKRCFYTDIRKAGKLLLTGGRTKQKYQCKRCGFVWSEHVGERSRKAIVETAPPTIATPAISPRKESEPEIYEKDNTLDVLEEILKRSSRELEITENDPILRKEMLTHAFRELREFIRSHHL